MKLLRRHLSVSLIALMTVITGMATARLFVRHSNAIFSEQFVSAGGKPRLTACRAEIMPTGYERVTSIKEIDFKNFTYPGINCRDFDVPTGAFRLRRGQYGDWHDGMRFRSGSFGDLSGDGKDEAIVSFDVLTDGNQARGAVYIFAIEEHRPKALYIFESGDRADGGLRGAYAKEGRFVLELWGPGHTLENSGNTERTGLCCPTTFTRSYYRWRNGAFKRDTFQVLPNPTAGSKCPTCQQ